MPDEHIETWREVLGFPAYEVSDFGRIRRISIDRPRTPRRCRLLKATPTKAGHLHVTLSYDNIKRDRYVHHLVLEAFVGPRPDGLEACHWNGVPGDNRLDNLRWDTRVANIMDRERHGTYPRGEQNNAARLSEDDVKAMRRRYREDPTSYRELGAEFGVSRKTAYSVIRRITWRHVP